MAVVVRLKASNKRLKQVIKQHGRCWLVLRTQDSVPCFDGRAGIFIESMDGEHTRWIELEDIEAAL